MIQPKFLDYKEWVKFHQYNEDDHIEDCDDCDGLGYTECTCAECGDEHEIECSTCGGECEISTLPTIYKEEKKKDQENWKRYNGQFKDKDELPDISKG